MVRKVEREGWCKERKSRREGMLDNGIKLGLRYIDTKLGIAILRGDHGYVRLYDCTTVVTLVVLSRWRALQNW